MNGIHQIVVYSDDVSLLGDNINTIKINTVALIEASNKGDLAGKNHNIKMCNRYFENAANFSYLGKTVTGQNLSNEKIKSTLNSGNVCCHAVQNILSSRLTSKNVKIRICKSIISSVVLHGSETLSLTLRGEHRMGVFENKVVKRISGLKRDEIIGGCIMRCFITRSLRQI
jgi:hypothetical protein